MQRWRTRPQLLRQVLAWWLLALAATVASPLIQPHTYQLVCSATAGSQWVVVDDAGDSTAPGGFATLDCPACWFAGTLPSLPVLPAAPPPSPSQWERLAPAPWPQVLAAGAPLPARGPPAQA